MGTRTRKLLSDLWSRKIRTLLVTTSIFIGVFGTITLITMGDLLVKQLEQDLDVNELSMLSVFLSPNPNGSIDNAALLDELSQQADVSIVEGQAVYPMTWKKPHESNVKSSSLLAYSAPLDSIQIEPMTLEEGHYPTLGQHEIVVEKRFAKQHELSIGDQLIVQMLHQADTGVSEEAWTITGIVFFPYGYDGINDVMPENSVFAHYDDAQSMLGFKGFSSIYLRYTSYAAAQAQATHITNLIAAEGSYIPLMEMTQDPHKNSGIQFAKTVGNVMASLALLGLLVSGFLVLNVITAIVTEQKQQIGALKSIGASRGDIVAIYAGMGFLYGVIGIIPALILGIPGGYFAAQGLASSTNSIIDRFDISPRAIFIGIAMGLLVPVLASIIPALSAAQVRIIDSVTNLGISSRFGQGFLARLVSKIPMPITVRQGINNVLRKRSRMLLTGLALTIAAGTFMGVFAALTSINAYLDDIFGAYHYQIEVTPNNVADLDAVKQLIEQDFSDLETRGSYVSMAIEIEGFDKEFDPATGPPALFASGFDYSYQPFTINLQDGVDLSKNPDGVVISRTIAEYLDKEAGDMLNIRAGGQSREFEIVGVSTYPFDAVWFDWEKLANLAGFMDESGTALPTGIIVSMNSADPSAAEVDAKISDINTRLLGRGITASYGNIPLLVEQIAQFVAIFQVIFYFAAILIAVVGAIGLLSTLSMSVFERQKEIGVIRSIGASSSTVITQFLSEGVSVGLVAWLIGIPLSYGVYVAMLAGLNLGDTFQVDYPLIVIVIGFVGIILITGIASLWPSLSAARKTVSDILRYQ